jgi:hypothetical protein
MYLAVLFIHSWLRWVLLALGLVLLFASIRGVSSRSPWTQRHERLHVVFIGVLDIQLVLGLTLYFVLSPITAMAMQHFGAAMKDAQLRFFGVEHIFTMLLAIIVAHVGRIRSKRKSDGARHRSVLITQAFWLLITLAAIPWPGLDIARPLFRM